MKKHKIKLIASLASFAMVVAVMGVGVWAATSQTLSVSTTVSFTAKGVGVTVTGNVTDNNYLSSTAGFYNSSTLLTKEVASAQTALGTDITLFQQAYDATSNANGEVSLKLNLDDNENGFIPENTTFTITYKVQNTGSNTIYMSLEQPSLSNTTNFDTFSVTVATSGSDGNYFEAYNSNNKFGYTLASGKNATITVSFSVKTNIESTIAADTALLSGMNFNFYNGYGSLPTTYAVTVTQPDATDGAINVGSTTADESYTLPEGSTITKNTDNTLTLTNKYTKATTVLTASPASGKTISNWQIDTTNYSESVTISAAKTITATFAADVPWTAMGTYVADTSNDIAYPNVTDWSTKTVEYDAFAGYNWVTFDAIPTADSIRWIIIGGDSANSTTTYGIGANVGDSVDNYDANQVLLLAEQVFVCSAFDYVNTSQNQYSATGSASHKELNDGYYKGLKGAIDLIASGTSVSTYNFSSWSATGSTITYTLPASNKIASVTLKTAYYADSSQQMDDDLSTKVFTLSNGYTVSTDKENYAISTYLGESGSSKNIVYSGSTASFWWLRSGGSSDSDGAHIVYSYGDVLDGDVSYSNGVRPAFVLDLG